MSEDQIVMFEKELRNYVKGDCERAMECGGSSYRELILTR